MRMRPTATGRVAWSVCVSVGHDQCRRQRGKGEASPLWVYGKIGRHLLKSYRTKPYKFPMHCSKCVSFWGASYSRPPTHTSLPHCYSLPPCYKILAAPLVTTVGPAKRMNQSRCRLSSGPGLSEMPDLISSSQSPRGFLRTTVADWNWAVAFL